MMTVRWSLFGHVLTSLMVGELMWPRRFLAVPTSALRVDADVAAVSSKGYSQRELEKIAATIPAVYDRMGNGWVPADFIAARWSQYPQDQRVGQTYVKLFQDSAAGSSLTATYDGTDLVVGKGNHRVRAARSIGVPVLPVWVIARTGADLDRVESACGQRIEREGAAIYREAHKLHDSVRQSSRAVSGQRAPDWEASKTDGFVRKVER
jgi:hypothetical protein